jgi:GNAT superfamily N-acetyltransferase
VHSRYVNGVTIRPLRHGDTSTVCALFGRLGDESRRKRFGGAKPRLSDVELTALARVDSTHHVLVAYASGDSRPAGIARLVRRGRVAEVAFAVADDVQGRGIGSALAQVLADDARAAGILELHATVTGDSRRVASLLSRPARKLQGSWSGGEYALRAVLD